MAMRKPRIRDCDSCGSKFPLGALRKYSRKKLRKTIKTIAGEKQDWIRPEYNNLNHGFQRKSRLCKNCEP